MSYHEGSKWQEQQEDAKRHMADRPDLEKKMRDKKLAEKLLSEVEPAIKAQNEKLVMCYEAAKSMDLISWSEWMKNKGYFIGKL